MAAKPKLTLSDDIKEFIVRRLACFDSPKTVVEAVKAEFGIALERQNVEAYNPERRAGAGLSDKWKQLFIKARAAFLDDRSDIPIAHQNVRLRKLGQYVERMEDMGNIGKAAELIEQASKEVGGAFSNKREISGPGGKPIAVEMTPLDAARRVAFLLRRGVEAAAKEKVRGKA